MPLQLPVVQTGLEASIQAAMKNAGKGAVINLGTSGKQISSLSQPLGRITGQADQFTKSMEAANARVFAFGASVGIINSVTNAFKGVISSTIEVETSLANIYSVLDKAGSNSKEFESGLFEAAKNAGQSFKVAADAALELSRQGLKSEDVLKRLNDTLILTRLSGLDSAAAVEGLSAAFNSFGESGITTAEIVNKLVAVSQKYAVSERDLIEGIKRAGSTAQQAGVSFDELAGLITAVQEKTARGGAVIGNSFKTIFARLQDTTTLEYLSNLGIGVVDLQGKVLPATRIMEGLAAKFNDFSKIGQADIAEKLGGIYQLGNLLAALQDLSSEQSKYAGAVKISAAAADQAYQKNAALNNTLESILNRVSVSAEQLGATLGSLGVTDNLKNILNFFNGLLDGIQKVLQEDSGIGKFFKGLVAGIGNLISGPGLALFGAIILKLSRDLVQFGFSSLKSFFGIGQAAKQIADVEKSVAQALSTNVSLQQRLLAVEGDRAAQLRIISGEIIAQEAMLRRIASTSAAIAPGLYGGGVRSTGQGLRVPKAAEGYMPAVAEEASSVKRGVGGAKPSDKPVVIPNFNFGGGKRGTMVANSGEHIVPNFNGSGGSAIFNRDMVRKMGMPSGAQKISSAGGFVPNYADKKILKWDKSNNLLSGEGYLLSSKKYSGVADVNKDSLKKDAVKYRKTVFKISGETLNKRATRIIEKGSKDVIKTALGSAAGITNVDLWVDKNRDSKQLIVQSLTEKKLVEFKDQKQGLHNAVKGALFEKYLLKNREDIIPFGPLPNEPLDFKFNNNIESLGIEAKSGDFSNHSLIAKAIRSKYSTKYKDGEKNTIGNVGTVDLFVPSLANGFIPNFAISQREAAYNAWDSPLKQGKSFNFVKTASAQSGTSDNKAKAIEISKALDLYIAQNSSVLRENLQTNRQESVTTRLADTSGAIAEFGMIYPSNSKGSISSFVVGNEGEVVKGIPIIGQPSDDLYPEIEKGIINAGINYAKNLGFKTGIIQKDKFAAGIKSHLNPGSIEGAFGTVFESVFQSAMGVPPNINQTFDLPDRSKLNSFVNSMQSSGVLKNSIDDNINPEMLAADFKNNLSSDNLNRMAQKISAFRSKQAIKGGESSKSVVKARKSIYSSDAENAAKGSIQNFAKYIYDADRISDSKGTFLKTVLAAKIKKNLIIGPAGSGKSTFAGSTGRFLTAVDDVKKATEIDILSGAGRTKDGGLSKNLQAIIEAVNSSGGKVSYLYTKNLDILKRRNERTNPAEGDLRSQKQLSGTRYAPLNQFDFMGAVKSQSRSFNVVNGAKGFVPNFAQKNLNYQKLAQGRDFESRIFDFFKLPPAGSRNLDFPQGVLSSVNPENKQKIGLKGSFGDVKLTRSQDNKTSLLGRLISEFNLFDALKNLTFRKKNSTNVDLNSLNKSIDESTLFYEGDPNSFYPEKIEATWASIRKANRDKPNFLSKFDSIIYDDKNKLRSATTGSKVSATVLLDGIADPKNTAAKGFVPNFVNPTVALGKDPEYARRQRERSAKAQKYRSAAGTIGNLFKILPEKFFADLVLGDAGHGLETEGIFKTIKDSAMYSASFAGPNAVKFVQGAESYGLKVSKTLQDKLTKLLVKATTKKSSANGFLPNFADPIKEAVGREMSAGVPASQIYIDQDSSLKNSMNPGGFMVANRRDEPMGGIQGIARARKEGSNPMTYGAANGFVPNYANRGSFQTPRNLTSSTSSLTSLNREVVSTATISQSAVNTAAAAAAASAAVSAAAASVAAKLPLPQLDTKQPTSTKKVNAETSIDKNSKMSSEKMLGTIFAIQGALSLFEGMVGEVTSSLGVALKEITGGLSTLTTGAFALQGLVGMGGMIGAVTAALGPFALVIGGAALAVKGFINYTNEKSGSNKAAATATERVDMAISTSSTKLSDYTKTQQQDLQTRGNYIVEGAMKESGKMGRRKSEGSSFFGLTDTPQLKAAKDIATKALASGAEGSDIFATLEELVQDNLFSNIDLDSFSQSIAKYIEEANKIPENVFNSLDKNSQIYKQLEAPTTDIEASLKDPQGVMLELITKLRDAGMNNRPAIDKTIIDQSAKAQQEKRAGEIESQKYIQTSTPEFYKKELESIIKINSAQVEQRRILNDSDSKSLEQAEILGNLSEKALNNLKNRVTLASEEVNINNLNRKAVEEMTSSMSALELGDQREALTAVVDSLTKQDTITQKEAMDFYTLLQKAIGKEGKELEALIAAKKQKLTTEEAELKITNENAQAHRDLSASYLNTKTAIDQVVSSATHLLAMNNIKLNIKTIVDTAEAESKIRTLELNKPQNVVAARNQAAQVAAMRYNLTQSQVAPQREEALNAAKTSMAGAIRDLGYSDEKITQNRITQIENAKTIEDLKAVSEQKALASDSLNHNLFDPTKLGTYQQNFDKAMGEYDKFNVNSKANMEAAIDTLKEAQLAPTIKKFSDYVIDLNDGIAAAVEQAKFEFLSATSGSALLESASKNRLNENLTKAGQNPSEISKAYADEAMKADQRRLALASSAQDRVSIEYDVKINEKILAIKQEHSETGKLSADQEERILELEKQRLEINKSLGQKFKEAFATSEADQINALNNSLIEGATKFRDTMIDGILQAVESGKSLKETLVSAAMDFTREMTRTALKNLANSTISMFTPSSAPKAEMASGGSVSGGSGSRDDVPAMLMGGEFVINKKSVNKYGPAFLEAINSGNLNAYASGGSIKKNSKKDFFAPGVYKSKSLSGQKELMGLATQAYTSGSRDKIKYGSGFASIALEPESVRLTNFGRRRQTALTDYTKSVKSQAFGIMGQEQTAERERKMQEEAEKKAMKKQIMTSILMLIGSAVVGYGASKMASSFAASKATGGSFSTNLSSGLSGVFSSKKTTVPTAISQAQTSSANNSIYSRPISSFNNVELPQGTVMEDYTSPAVPLFPNTNTRRATGGIIPASAGIDTIPAMLSGGEFIMNRAATQNIGQGPLQAMNAGASSMMSEEKSTELNDKLIKKLDEIVGASSGSKGDVSININSTDGKTTSSSQTNNGTTEDRQRLAQNIKDVVLKVIQDEKRLGGQLRRGM